MLWLLLFACDNEGKPSSGGGDDSSGYGDTGDTSDDTGGGGEQADCTLGLPSPLTVPVNTEGSEVAVPFRCGDDTDIDRRVLTVQVQGTDAPWTFHDNQLIIDTSGVLSAGVLTLEVELQDDEDLSTTVRGHKKNLLDEFEQTMVRDMGENWEELDESRLITSDGTVLLATETELLEFGADGSLLATAKLSERHGVCQLGECFCSAYSGGEVCHTGENAVLWADIDKGSSENKIEIDEVVDAVMWRDAPRAIGTMDSVDRTGLYGTDLATGELWSITTAPGDFRLLGETVVSQGCEKEELSFSDFGFESGKKLTSAIGSLECSPDDWMVQITDVDADGLDDQVHTLSYADEDTLVVRLGLDTGGYGPVIEVTGQPARVRWPFGSTGQRLKIRALMRDSEGRATSYTINTDGITAELIEPVYHGDASFLVQAETSLIPPSYDSPFVMGETNARWLTGSGCEPCETELAVNEAGEALTRTRSGDEVSFTFAGSEVTGSTGAPDWSVFEDTVVFAWGPDLLIDEREYTWGDDGEWESVRPFGVDQDGIVLFMAQSDKALEFFQVDLGDLGDGGELSVDQTQTDTILEESGMDRDAFYAMSIKPGDGTGVAVGEVLATVEGALDAPTAILTVPWNTGTACPLATVVLPGHKGSFELDGDDTIIYSTGTDADCSDLVVPMVTADLFGDYSWVAVMSNGKAIGLHEGDVVEYDLFTPPAGLEAVTSADLNGDGYGDMLLQTEEGEHSWWLGGGDTTTVDSEDEKLPDWIGLVVHRSISPGAGRPATAIFPTSWAAMLD